MTPAASMSVRCSDRLRRLCWRQAVVAVRFVPARTHAPDAVARPRISPARLAHARACGRRRRAHDILIVAVHAGGITSSAHPRAAGPASRHCSSTLARETTPRRSACDDAAVVSLKTTRHCMPGPPLRFGPSGVFVADHRDSAHAGRGWSRAGDKEGAVKWLPSVP